MCVVWELHLFYFVLFSFFAFLLWVPGIYTVNIFLSCSLLLPVTTTFAPVSKCGPLATVSPRGSDLDPYTFSWSGLICFHDLETQLFLASFLSPVQIVPRASAPYTRHTKHLHLHVSQTPQT